MGSLRMHKYLNFGVSKCLENLENFEKQCSGLTQENLFRISSKIILSSN